MIETWTKWIAAFDQAFETDDWTEAQSLLTDDVVYIVAGTPFACDLRGLEQVIEGFRKSLANFDRKFDSRSWEAVDVKVWADHAVTGLAKGNYTLTGKPEITFAARSAWFFRGDRICLMTDIYDVMEVNAMRTLQWLAAHGADMDPSYA
ncbi:MAG: nuclear transport factor 2 family protein [Pseudomonadota bacterium]